MDISTMTGDMLREEVKRLQEENRELQNELVNGIHTCGPKCRKTPRCAQIADLREELAECRGALGRLIGIRCELLHHNRDERHEDCEPCPVLERVNAARKGEGEK